MFIGTASAAFFVLGAVPMGWLADRVKRVPIVGIASLLVRRSSRSSSGLALERVHVLLDASSSTGIAKANNIAVHQSLIADNYPIGIRARMSAVMNLGEQASASPARSLVGRDRDVGRRPRGLAVGVVHARHPGRRSSRSFAFFMKEPPRGQFEKDDVLGEVDRGREPRADLDGGRVRPAEEDRDDPHVDRRVLPRSASACSPGQPRVALPERHAARRRRPARAGSSSASSGCAAVPFLPSGRRATSTAPTARTRPRRSCSSAC